MILTLEVKLDVNNRTKVDDIIVDVAKALHEAGLDCVGVKEMESNNEQLPEKV